ncbi:MAG: hypothetical protein ABI270_05185 [Nitrosospira sp.]
MQKKPEVPITPQSLLSTTTYDSDYPLSPIAYPELVFGLVGPVGVSLEPVISILSLELKALNYKTKAIRLSKQIELFFDTNYSKESEDEELQS